MFTSLIKRLSDPVLGQTGLEEAFVAQVATYQPSSFQIYDVSNHSEQAVTCIIGNYMDSAGGANIQCPFYAVNTNGEGLTSPNWIIGALNTIVDFAGGNDIESSALLGLDEILSSSAGWAQGWVAAGTVRDSTTQIGLSPFIVNIDFGGAVTVTTAELGGLSPFKPSAWLLTNSGADATQPTILCDVSYDAQNDAIVAVGGACDPTNPFTYSMVVEQTAPGVAPTFIYSLNYGRSNDLDWPSFLRSCSIQTQDAAGATVANRTIVTTVGFSRDSAANPALEGCGTISLYQPLFSNTYVGVNPRWAWIDRGVNSANDLYALQGLAANAKPNDMNLSKRITADGEDLYMLCGATTTGPYVYALGAVITDSGAGNDNIINQTGVTTTLNLVEASEQSASALATTVAPLTNNEYSTIWDVIGVGRGNGTSGRRTKLYSQGSIDIGRFAPRIPDPAMAENGSAIFAVSRGLKIWSNEVTNHAFSIGLFRTGDTRLKMAQLNFSATTKILYSRTSYVVDQPAILNEVAASTGHGAYAWFEYMLYDGVDSLIARKLNEMGVRVTIGNVEWYKQSILKKGLDVSTDFFTEWGELQVKQNQDREREAEQFGRKRPPKRAVRTEIFDDYADWEEKETQVESFPDYDPNKDGQPFQDDVAKEQQIEKTQKAVDDLRKIEEVIEEGDVDEAEYDDAADVSDWGEN